MVDPKFFSKGIGTKLVQYALENLKNNREVIVSTGDRNLPAKKLHKKIGFIQKRVFVIDEISIAEFGFKQ